MFTSCPLEIAAMGCCSGRILHLEKVGGASEFGRVGADRKSSDRFLLGRILKLEKLERERTGQVRMGRSCRWGIVRFCCLRSQYNYMEQR